MNHWEFWIDVGGTFTDCLARTPEGKLIPLKLLSSGVTKGQVSQRTASHQFTDPSRQNDPACFRVGYESRLLDATGQPIHASKVTEFDHLTGTVTVDQPLPEELSVGTNYELALWLQSHNDQELKHSFDELGQSLLEAQEKYVQAKELDEALFGEDYE